MEKTTGKAEQHFSVMPWPAEASLRDKDDGSPEDVLLVSPLPSLINEEVKSVPSSAGADH